MFVPLYSILNTILQRCSMLSHTQFFIHTFMCVCTFLLSLFQLPSFPFSRYNSFSMKMGAEKHAKSTRIDFLLFSSILTLCVCICVFAPVSTDCVVVVRYFTTTTTTIPLRFLVLWLKQKKKIMVREGKRDLLCELTGEEEQRHTRLTTCSLLTCTLSTTKPRETI